MNCAYYAAQGFSMEPSVLDGDELIVNTSPVQSYRVGDIVLYRSPHHPQPVAHRLVMIDHTQSLVVIRSDANPRAEETLGVEAIIGRVEQLRRGDVVLHMGGHWTRTWMNHVTAMARPSMLALKEAVATWVLPLLITVQGTQLYRKAFHGRVTADIRLIPLRDAAGLDRFVATVRRQYAGGIDVAWRSVDGRSYGVISSLIVRARYRRAGLATQLLQRVENEALVRGAQELQVEHERTNQIAAKLYEQLGYRVVPRDGTGLDSGMIQRKKLFNDPSAMEHRETAQRPSTRAEA